MNHVEEYCPQNPEEWRNWLEKHHVAKDAVWLVLYRKKSPSFNLGWSDAVDHALCFGWIDSTKRTIDHESYKQYFTKRKPKSNWSKVNKEKVQSLIEQGLMTQVGHKSIEIAKENGSWTLLDAIEALEVPEDLQSALAKTPGAADYFDSLSKSSKKILLYWVISAKRAATRSKRIGEVVEHAGRGELPERFR